MYRGTPSTHQSHPEFFRHRVAHLRLLCLICLLLVLGACGRNREQSVDVPAPEQSAPLAEASDQEQENASLATRPALASLVDTNLLLEPATQTTCDGSDHAKLDCDLAPERSTLTINVAGSEFARWRLAWSNATNNPLTGTETLHLRIQAQGNLSPHLYLNDGTERRITVNLPLSRTTDDWQDIYLPLAEIKDDQGAPLDYATIAGLELVFEWADMEGSLQVESVRFASKWVEVISVDEEAQALAAGLTVPPGFRVEPLATGFGSMTQLQFLENGDLLISLQNGRVWWLTDTDGDSTLDQRHLYIAGLTEIVGLLYDPTDGGIWLGGRGQLYKSFDVDGNGVGDQLELRIDGLPWGRHQNNGLTWNPAPDPFTGEAGGQWIYFGLGSTGDLEVGGELSAKVLRFPRDGQGEADLEVVSHGNRNPYMLVWGEVDGPGDWQLFASENGPDFNDAPDEVNHIRWQHHYGFPDYFGTSFDEPEIEFEGLPYSGSLYNVTPHASSSGLAYVNHPNWPDEYQTLYLSLFGQVFNDAIVGHMVQKITLTPVETSTGLTYRGEPSTFIDGLDRPLPMTTDGAGNLIVGEYAWGVVFRVVYE